MDDILEEGDEKMTISEPQQLVVAARKLITETRIREKNNLELSRIIEVDALPNELRISGLSWCKVHYDHIDLVTTRNPDYSRGLRVWSTDSTREHKDKPTRYPEIFIFNINGTEGEIVKNIRNSKVTNKN